MFFAALAGVGYEAPASLEALPIATELEALHPAVTVKRPTLEKGRLATVVRAQATVGADAPAIGNEGVVSPMHAHVEAAHQLQGDWIQDSPNDPALDNNHAAHVHHAPNENIYDKARLSPEGHAEHAEDAGPADVAEPQYQDQAQLEEAEAKADSEPVNVPADVDAAGGESQEELEEQPGQP